MRHYERQQEIIEIDVSHFRYDDVDAMGISGFKPIPP